jgi:MerR family transcriptional regulator, redox-sensitive transcriptional activator SoxR
MAKAVIKKELSVGEVAARSGLAVSAIHFYESKGLIKSARNNANHRRYPRDVLRKLGVIGVAQRAGIPLREISEALATLPDEGKVTAEQWSRLASLWREDLDERIDRLTRLRDTIGYCIGCGCLSVKDCSLMNANDKLAEEGAGARLLDPNS